ncbi:MAG: hypothetical protein ACKVOA_00285 [Methylophilaceae bacterium]
MIKLKLILLVLAASLLGGCVGGPIIQQIASSIATKVADNAIANAMDVQDGPSNKKQDNGPRKDTVPDDTWMMMATAGFQPVDPNTQIAPDNVPEEPPVQVFQSNHLVRVQLFNLLIGDEKTAVFEKARLVGALNLPDKREWSRWHVATGVTEKDKKMITFLIPPEFGKLPSGTLAMVELAGPGDLNIARYK